MKSLILGAFIICMFFAVAQSVSIGQQTMQSNLKQSSSLSEADSGGRVEYAGPKAPNSIGIPKTGTSSQAALALRGN